MMLNADGYSHEIVTDENGRTWLKPAVTTVVHSFEAADRDVKDLAELAAADMRRTMERPRRRSWWKKKNKGVA